MLHIYSLIHNTRQDSMFDTYFHIYPDRNFLVFFLSFWYNSDFFLNALQHISRSRAYTLFFKRKDTYWLVFARKRAGYLALTAAYSRFYLTQNTYKTEQRPDLDSSFNFWPTVFVVHIVIGNYRPWFNFKRCKRMNLLGSKRRNFFWLPDDSSTVSWILV